MREGFKPGDIEEGEEAELEMAEWAVGVQEAGG